MRRYHVIFAAAIAAMGILFLVIVNRMFCPGYVWFYYPAFVLLWLPLTALLMPRHKTGYALAGSALTIAFLATVNLQNSPGHPWFLYAAYPFVWWPILVAACRRVGRLWLATLCAAVTVAYYAALNIFISPGYPWAIYPAFAVLWWPLSVYCAKRKCWFGYSVAAALMISAFFIVVNLVSSPGAVWAVYPVFAASWWPLSVYYFIYKKERLVKQGA